MALRRRELVAIVALACVVVAYLAVDESRSRSDWTLPASRDLVRGPGSELGDGFVVPPGARAVGRSLPLVYRGAAEFVTQRAALMLVDGDPLAVYDNLARQARSAGFNGIATADETCTTVTTVSEYVQPPSDPRWGEWVASVRCSAGERIDQHDGDVSDDPSVRITVERGPSELMDTWFSHAVIEWSPGDWVASPGSTRVPPSRRAPPMPSPRKRVELAAEGEQFAHPTVVRREDVPYFRVEQGSELVAAPGPWGMNGGFIAMLRVTDRRPQQVFRDYVEQFDALDGTGFDSRPPMQVEAATASTILGGGIQPGGDAYMFRLFEFDGAFWIVVTYAVLP